MNSAFDCGDCLPCCSQRFYIGQSRRQIAIRYKEHLADFFNDRIGKSSVADHLIGTGHDYFNTSQSLAKPVSEPKLLDAWESLIISLNKNKTMNGDQGRIVSDLFNLTSKIKCDKFKY